MATPIPNDALATSTANANPTGAQSPAPSPSAFQHGATGEKTFTEADIAAARKQEKDKLYEQLASYKDQLSTIQKQLDLQQKLRDEEQAELTRQAQEKEAKAKKKKEEEMSAKALLERKLQETNSTWEERFNQLQAERDKERELASKERRYNELVEYRNSMLNDYADEIAPEFHAFINGDSEDQIKAAVERARAATTSIVEQMKAAQQKQMSQMRGVSATGYGPMGPLESQMGQETYTAEDINNMSMAQYAEFRQKSGLAERQSRSSRGLLG